MAEQNEKDNTMLYVGGVVFVAIVLVMLLKADETKHLKTSPELSKEQVTKKNVHPSNKFTE
jgi:hypothetical protein